MMFKYGDLYKFEAGYTVIMQCINATNGSLAFKDIKFLYNPRDYSLEEYWQPDAHIINDFKFFGTENTHPEFFL